MKRKRSGILMKLVILSMLLYALSSLIRSAKMLSGAENDRLLLQERLIMLRQENSELDYELAHARDPETIASVARAQLGLVLPGEKVFYDISD